MATAELPRPGVEIIQEFQAAAPTVLQPTLVPFVTGPAMEIVEVTTSDGLLNAKAKQGSYSQLPRVISQTSFPSPRNNIAEVTVDTSSIEAFFQFGGSLKQLMRDPGQSFLTAFNFAQRAAIRSNFFVTSSGLDLNGKIMVLAIDVPARLNLTKDVTVTFAGSGNLTPTQIVDQINTAVGDTVASIITIASDTRIQIASNKYGALSSVTVRAGGSANTTFGFGSASSEYRAEAPGFRAQDQNNNTTLSPWIEWYAGDYLVDGVSTSFPTYDDTIPSSGIGIGFLDSNAVFTTAKVKNGTTFLTGGLDLKVGDQFWADGAQPNSAVIMKVESARFKLGTVNAKLSTFDSKGNVTNAVYDQSQVGTILAAAPLAPRYAWFMAENITGLNTAATAAVLTGATEGTAATTATIISPAVPAGSSPYALAGLTLVFTVTVNGVAQADQTFTFTGGPFAALSDIVNAVNAGGLSGLFAHTDTGGTKIAFSTNLTGATQSLVLKASSTGLVALGFVASTAYTATGTDVQFNNVPATLLTSDQTFSFTATNGQTLVIKYSTDGGSTYSVTRTYTFTTGTLTFANINALVTELNTATHWDGATLPTQFSFSASGAKLKLSSTLGGHLIGLKVDSTSTAIGVTSNTQIGFSSNQADTGEDELTGQTLEFTLNGRDHTYETVFTSDSLVDAVAAINNTVGFTVASIGGTSDDQLVLTSTLTGYASSITVLDNSTTQQANRALGFGSGNRTATGSGRPDPDFYVDDSGNVVLGAEILRSALTGDPFDPGTADIYIQYKGVRKDVSPLAAKPALLSIADTTTLNTVLSPIRSDNPLALGMFFAILNAPGIACTGMGVDETTATAPNGTLEAYSRVASFLESQEVYAIAPLTADITVHQMFKTHIELMSGPAQKGERILFVCPPVPTRAVDTVIASGVNAESTATSNQLVVDVNPAPGLIAAGLNPLELTYADQVYIDLVVNGVEQHYLLQTVNGTLCVLQTTFTTGQNTDGFFSTTTLTSTVLNADWSVKIRGAKLLIPGSTLPDKDAIAATVAASSNAYAERRMYVVFPDTVRATINGLDEEIPGFYACAAMTGMVAQFAPQQGFTNLPMTGFTGVLGSNDTFSVSQLDTMAGGGTYILVQEAQGAPIIARHQLSTNISSVETRELSITKVVDYAAKFLRIGLRNFIGTFNITQPFLDTLSTVIQGMLGFLTENGIILGGDLNNLIQSKDAPDTVLVDVTLDVPFPCNYIRLTLVI